MGWQINFGADKSVDLDDLAPEVFEALAEDDNDATWFSVYLSPGANPERLYAIVCAAADHASGDRPRPRCFSRTPSSSRGVTRSCCSAAASV